MLSPRGAALAVRPTAAIWNRAFLAGSRTALVSSSSGPSVLLYDRLTVTRTHDRPPAARRSGTADNRVPRTGRRTPATTRRGHLWLTTCGRTPATRRRGHLWLTTSGRVPATRRRHLWLTTSGRTPATAGRTVATVREAASLPISVASGW